MTMFAFGLFFGMALGILIALIGDRDIRRWSYTVGWDARGEAGMQAIIGTSEMIDRDIKASYGRIRRQA